MRFFLEHRRPPSVPQRAVPFPTHMPFPLPRLLAPAWLLLLAGEWGWSPEERLRLPPALPGGHRGQMGKLWPLGLWPERVWLTSSARSLDAWGWGVCVCPCRGRPTPTLLQLSRLPCHKDVLGERMSFIS